MGFGDNLLTGRWHAAGRVLRVIYVRDPDGDEAFVVTSYELTLKALAAFRRRRRRKK